MKPTSNQQQFRSEQVLLGELELLTVIFSLVALQLCQQSTALLTFAPKRFVIQQVAHTSDVSYIFA